MTSPLPRIDSGGSFPVALAADLSAARFTVDGLDALWGPEAAAALFRGDRVPARRAVDRLSRPEPPERVAARATLARCFVLGLAVSRDALAAALPSAGVDHAIAAGLVRPAGVPAAPSVDTASAAHAADYLIEPLVDLRPYAFSDDRGSGHFWIVSDLGEMAVGGPLSEQHVLGIGGASTTLAGLMLPVQVATALDLGTGCGIQALHARRFADHVVATDISERALAVAQFNAALNGIDGIEFRLGSLFEPVAGERFDRIVSNPPFVITPRRDNVPSYEYRDGGMVGDALVEQVLRGVEEHLEPGGTAQLLGNWEYRSDQDALDRVAGWFAHSALDVWIVERERQDPAAYAETWVRDGGTRPGTPAYESLIDAWLDDFAARSVTEVGFGYVLLRASRSVESDPAIISAGRPGGSDPLRRFERRPESLGSAPMGLGPTIARGFDALDWLRATDDADLLRARLRAAGDVTEERHYWPGNDDPTVITLVQGGGFGRRIDAGTALAACVGACDGELTLGAIAGAIAQLTEADESALVAELLPQVRSLVLDGLLLPR